MRPDPDLDAGILRLVARGETRSLAIAGALGIPLRSVQRGLVRLADLGLIEQPGRGVWRLTADDVAWGSDAARALLRTLAAADAQARLSWGCPPLWAVLQAAATATGRPPPTFANWPARLKPPVAGTERRSSGRRG